MRKLIIAGLSVGVLTLAAAFIATGASAAPAGAEGCIVKGANGGAAVGNPVQSTSADPPGAPSVPPAATCDYSATVAAGWVGGGTVTISYGPGTFDKVTKTCNFGTAGAANTVAHTTPEPFVAPVSPPAIGPIKATDCVHVVAG